MAANTRQITGHDGAEGAEESTGDKLRVMTGLTPDALDLVARNFELHIRKSQRGLVKLVPESGGLTITVKASSLTPTARSYESLKDVKVPGYRIERLPALDIHRALEQTLEAAAMALIRTFREPLDAQKWLRAPNPAFANHTPISVLEDGKPHAIATVLNAAQQGVAL
ncbi:MbcA/ParS/Xre antitoxin family protein [Deinococcus oregonensis]|uniref:MbcA/ParS/Xre antitoxin family protein n=1 Tax=Deinococcus oregonensis TaxID=1805970 RepID=A0ABV6AWZ1_9DEIO